MEMENVWKVAVPEGFRFQENIRYLANANHECMYQVINNQVLKAINVDKTVFLIELSEAKCGELLVRVVKSSHSFSEANRSKITAYVRDWFDLDTDLADFYQMAENDIFLQTLVHTFYGLRLIGIPNFFEAISWAIIGQQINLFFAYKLKRRLVERFGQSIRWNGGDYWLFPTPDVIANVPVSELTSLQLSKRKSEYLIDIARSIIDGALSKEKLLAADGLEEAEKILTRHRGIGSWTAHYVLMRCFRFPNAFPIADAGLQNTIKQLARLEKKPSKEYMLQLGSGWENWQGYATFYLWRTLYQ